MTVQEEILQQESNTTPDSSPSHPDRNASWDKAAGEFASQVEKLSHQHPSESDGDGIAVEARFVTPQDPVLVTSDGNRLPPVPLEEAHKLNVLREELKDHRPTTLPASEREGHGSDEAEIGPATDHVARIAAEKAKKGGLKSPDGSLRRSMPPTHTNPLFPPLPLYGPPSLLRNIQCRVFQISSFFLSLAFLEVIVLGALFTSIGPWLKRRWQRLTFRNPDAARPFYEEEMKEKKQRKEKEREWMRRQAPSPSQASEEGISADGDGFTPTEGGPDPIVCDPAYYARRVGLDMEIFQVQTEDGFIIELWHVYDPKEYQPLPPEERAHGEPEAFRDPKQKHTNTNTTNNTGSPNQKPKFPVLLMHGLLQSSGAYCVNDDASLAFYLCKSGFDVWLGNNRCGFQPRHALLDYADPRMWCWNIRQMGVFDLPALAARVLYETGFARLGLICHSQGTTQTLVALAKEQRPALGERLTVFCALAPAAYAGPLIGKMYFKFMRVITPAMFRLMFGIHAFIPLMMATHRALAPRIYGWLGYKVFSFLFNWSDTRWDRGLRDRMFQFAPVYVSSESMRWWLGRECFARHKCILATKEEWRAEEREDHEREQQQQRRRRRSVLAADAADDRDAEVGQQQAAAGEKSEQPSPAAAAPPAEAHKKKPRGSTAWYNHQAPPFALWVCGNDALVDGGKLLRRFERGREPHVRVVHSKVIPEYEHLDVIWAMDAPEQVFKEVREVLWKTCDVRDVCRVPRGCEEVEAWVPPERGGEEEEDLVSSSSEDL
ncbi:Alpha/Beta hydrolase protein [Chaetomium fimeti]|uniref:Alpha/Beta hydrolase protein n=1 Tax=Chaetomium fimeti TaxID=1854472 RepID=A0AAE0HPD3_9PEZI|nr:Alpha/Beta hydrolase protein [Chaetomium fimeti]